MLWVELKLSNYLPSLFMYLNHFIYLVHTSNSIGKTNLNLFKENISYLWTLFFPDENQPDPYKVERALRAGNKLCTYYATSLSQYFNPSIYPLDNFTKWNTLIHKILKMNYTKNSNYVQVSNSLKTLNDTFTFLMY